MNTKMEKGLHFIRHKLKQRITHHSGIFRSNQPIRLRDATSSAMAEICDRSLQKQLRVNRNIDGY